LDEKLRYVRIQLDKVSLRELLEELLDTISFEAYQKGLDLALDDRLSQDDDEVDGHRLKQVLHNLLSNTETIQTKERKFGVALISLALTALSPELACSP